MKTLKTLSWLIILLYSIGLLIADFSNSHQEMMGQICFKPETPVQLLQGTIMFFLWMAAALLFCVNITYIEAKAIQGEKFFYVSQIWLCVGIALYERFGNEKMILDHLYIHPFFVLCVVAVLSIFVWITFCPIVVQTPKAKQWMSQTYVIFGIVFLFNILESLGIKALSFFHISRLALAVCMFAFSWNMLIEKFVSLKNSQPHSLTSRIISHRNQKE